MSLTGTPVMVLGAFRSGTSSLASVLVKLGVYFGREQDLYGANEFNPGGHFELTDMHDLHARILDSFGIQFYSGRRLPDDWQTWPAAQMMVGGLANLLTKHFAGQKLWGWKEPWGSVLVPLYREALARHPEPIRFAITVRNPLSVLSSMRVRSKLPGKKDEGSDPNSHADIDIRTMGSWVYFTLATLKDTAGHPRQVVIYENFLQRPREYVLRLVDIVAPNATEQQIEDAIGTIDPKLSHTKFNPNDLRNWPSIISRVYELCIRADKDPKGFQEGVFDAEIDELWEEWKHTQQMLRPLHPIGEQILVSAKTANHITELRTELNRNSSWTHVSSELDLAPNMRIVMSPLRSPCQVWIRNAVWKQNGATQRARMAGGADGMLEDVYGLNVLCALGPDALLIDPPGKSGTAVLEMDLLIESEANVLVSLMVAIRDQMERRMPAIPRRRS